MTECKNLYLAFDVQIYFSDEDISGCCMKFIRQKMCKNKSVDCSINLVSFWN